MSRQSITKTQQSENSTSLSSSSMLRRKTTSRRSLSTPTIDRRNPQVPQTGASTSLFGETSPLYQHFSQIPVLSNSPYSIQAKLKIGQPNDKYEQEADRVADQVMRMSDPRPSSLVGNSPLDNNAIPRSGTIQRTCASCSGEYKTAEEENRLVQSENLCPKCRTQGQGLIQTMPITPFIQTKTTGNVTSEVTPEIGAEIKSLQGGGQPLSQSERGFFEPRFGADFSDVRVHSDARAAGLAQSVNARAFTHGQDVVFGAGEYSPKLGQGRRLLAHELTHVVQQDDSNKFGFKTSIESDPIDRATGLLRAHGPMVEPLAVDSIPWSSGDAAMSGSTMRIYDVKPKDPPSWRLIARHDLLTGEPMQEPPVSFGVLNEKFGRPEPATQPLTSFGHGFGNIAVTAPSSATPAQAAPTPAPAPAPGPASPAATTKFPIKSSFTVTDKIEQKGPAPAGFGLTSPNVLRTFARTDHVNGVWETPVSLHIEVPWQVGSSGRTDIPSKEASAITQKNYKTVVDDLTPPAKSGVVGGLFLYAGQPPRTQFWAENLTIKHEEFHAAEDVKFGREGADRARKWLDRQTAQDANEVGTHLDKVPGIAARWIDTKMVKPASELRAYAHGKADYQARVDAIQALGDKNGYRAGARRRRARKARKGADDSLLAPRSR